MKPEDKKSIIDFTILTVFAVICIVGILLVFGFIFFYGGPLTIALCVILIMFKIRLCDGHTEISLEKIIQKYIKISITITK